MDQVKKLFLDKEFMDKMKHMGGLVGAATSVHKIIGPIVNNISPLISCKIGQDVMGDVEMYQSFDGSMDQGTIMSSIRNCSSHALSGSHLYLTEILSHPISCIDTLKKRQKVIQDIEAQPSFDRDLAILAECESDMLWIFNHQESEVVSLYEMVYFKFVLLKNLNERPECITAYNMYKIILSPLIGLLSPVVYLLIPYMIMRIKMKINMGFLNYIKMMISTMLQGNSLTSSKLSYISFAFSLLFYFQGLFNNVELAKAVLKISSFITNKMNNVVRFVTAAENLFLATQDLDMDSFGIPAPYECKTEFTHLATTPYSSLSNFGTHLHAFKYFEKDHYKNLLRKTYLLDAIVTICKCKLHHKFTYPQYINDSSTVPRIQIQGLWHPSLENPVKNDIDLDRSIIITGPNAGGKSTMIKGTLIAILFSQTIAVANADMIKITPLNHVNSQMNIPDCKGKESLFEAEMYRSKHNIDILKEKGPQFKSIIFMDEIFNSTNPVEGIAGAYAIAKNMSSYPNNLSIITTHYMYLTKLSKELPERFKCCKMNVLQEGGDIIYPYRLTRGVSRQFIAIELLKKSGFDRDIVEDALLIKKRLMGVVDKPVP